MTSFFRSGSAPEELAPSQRNGEPGGDLDVSMAVRLVVTAALVFGCVARLIWPFDIEYKGDEIWTFEHVQSILAGGPLSWVGMGTSVTAPHPGMSLWVFAALGFLFRPRIAPDLATAVQIANIVALLGFVIFVRTSIDARFRETWHWAAALWAVNPAEIIFERKIWPPSILPPRHRTDRRLVASWYDLGRFHLGIARCRCRSGAHRRTISRLRNFPFGRCSAITSPSNGRPG